MKPEPVRSILFKVILLFFLLWGESATAQAPNFEWVKRSGGLSQDYGRAIAVDGSGNSYIVGSFEGTATFGSTTLTSSGNIEVFVAKFDASGNVVWAQSAGGTGSEAGFGIAVDHNGNSYITGSFEGSATFGSTTLTSSGSMDVFVAKYDSSGNVLWAQRAGGTMEDVGRAIAVDGSGNSYISGSFQGNVTIGNTTYTSSGSFDVFVARFDASGNNLWWNAVGGIEMDSGQGIAVDGSGNSYVTGYFQDTVLFGSNTLIGNGNIDMFIAKLDSAGNVLWVRDAFGAATDAIGMAIAADGNGNSYVTGHFRGVVILGGTALTSSGNSDLLVAKYDSSGNVLWARKAGGAADDSGRGIAVDGSGNSYITGFFGGIVSFGSTTLSSNGNTDVIIAKYDNAGNVLWAKKGGGAGIEFGLGIAVDGNGLSYSTGFFEGNAAFGSTTLSVSGQRDMFLAKVSTVTGLPEFVTANHSVYPNPFTSSFQIALATAEPATATLTDALGREVHRQTVTPESGTTTATITPPATLKAGFYLLQLRQGSTVQQVRVMRQ